MALQVNYNHDVEYNLVNSQNVETLVSVLGVEQRITVPLDITNAYVKVGEVSGNKEQLTYTLEVYVDFNKEVLVTKKVFRFTPDVADGALNFIKQCYLHTKTLPEFVSAIDILED